MSTQRNRPGTAEGTEATVVRESQSTANSPVRHYPNFPPINQLISDEVELFFRADQTRYTPEQVESKLLHAINTRILTENAQGGLKGAQFTITPWANSTTWAGIPSLARSISLISTACW